jgi:hypothetical protein
MSRNTMRLTLGRLFRPLSWGVGTCLVLSLLFFPQVAAGQMCYDCPTLELPVGGRSVIVGETLTFTVRATKGMYGSGIASLTMTVGPPGAVFETDQTEPEADTVTGTFEWTPADGQEGQHTVAFRATAGDASTSGTVRVTALARSNAAELKVPRKIFALVGEPISFNVYATDPDGDPVTLSLASDPLPGASFLDRGAGLGTYTITPEDALADSTHTLVFQADDGLGGVATASTLLCVQFRRGLNPPRLSLPGEVQPAAPGATRRAEGAIQAPAGELTQLTLEALDPDGGPVQLRLDSSGELDVTLEAGLDAAHPVLEIRPTLAERGQMYPVTVVGIDAAGMQTTSVTTVEVPPAEGVEVGRYEVRWAAPPAGDPFEAPVNVEAFAVGETTEPVLGPENGLLGYAIYASRTAGFALTDQTLVALASASARNARVVLVAPVGEGGAVWYVRVTSRRVEGESRGSAEAATDTPRIPGAVLKNGKLIVPAQGSQLEAGAQLEVRQAVEALGERFALVRDRRGKKWLVKKSAESVPGGKRVGEMVRPGQSVILIAINPDGKTSAPYAFTP